jgi:hypothetical protein
VQLEIMPKIVDFGVLYHGSVAEKPVSIKYSGTGKIEAKVQTRKGLEGLGLNCKTIYITKDEDIILVLTVDTQRLPAEATSYNEDIVLQFGDYKITIPVSFNIVPILARIHPEKLDMGTSKQAVLNITSVNGMGKVFGKIRPKGYLPGLQVPREFDSNSIKVRIDIKGDAPPSSYDGEIIIQSNGGTFRVPVSYRVESSRWGLMRLWAF